MASEYTFPLVVILHLRKVRTGKPASRNFSDTELEPDIQARRVSPFDPPSKMADGPWLPASPPQAPPQLAPQAWQEPPLQQPPLFQPPLMQSPLSPLHFAPPPPPFASPAWPPAPAAESAVAGSAAAGSAAAVAEGPRLVAEAARLDAEAARLDAEAARLDAEALHLQTVVDSKVGARNTVGAPVRNVFKTTDGRQLQQFVAIRRGDSVWVECALCEVKNGLSRHRWQTTEEDRALRYKALLHSVKAHSGTFESARKPHTVQHLRRLAQLAGCDFADRAVLAAAAAEKAAADKAIALANALASAANGQATTPAAKADKVPPKSSGKSAGAAKSASKGAGKGPLRRTQPDEEAQDANAARAPQRRSEVRPVITSSREVQQWSVVLAPRRFCVDVFGGVVDAMADADHVCHALGPAPQVEVSAVQHRRRAKAAAGRWASWCGDGRGEEDVCLVRVDFAVSGARADDADEETRVSCDVPFDLGDPSTLSAFDFARRLATKFKLDRDAMLEVECSVDDQLTDFLNLRLSAGNGTDFFTAGNGTDFVEEYEASSEQTRRVLARRHARGEALTLGHLRRSFAELCEGRDDDDVSDDGAVVRRRYVDVAQDGIIGARHYLEDSESDSSEHLSRAAKKRSISKRKKKPVEEARSRKLKKKKSAVVDDGIDDEDVLGNTDSCLICGGGGELWCCDACPRSAHAACAAVSTRDAKLENRPF
ncbi:hypothetical protein M885DRAFT_173358 [Pelagophyceae sp. CCMP2097]|nr:hypothetical protein M885DRAFT_173358 [Pelagophyceae sp. CCMP2097]